MRAHQLTCIYGLVSLIGWLLVDQNAILAQEHDQSKAVETSRGESPSSPVCLPPELAIDVATGSSCVFSLNQIVEGVDIADRTVCNVRLIRKGFIVQGLKFGKTRIALWGDGPDLRLKSWGDGSGVPTSGQSLVILGTDGGGLIHIRSFDVAGIRTDTFERKDGSGSLHLVSTDASGKVLSDVLESSFGPIRSGAITALKQQLPGLLPPHVMTRPEMDEVIGEVRSIAGYIRDEDSIRTFDVIVMPDRKDVMARLLKKYPGSGLRLVPENGKVIVEGTLPYYWAVEEVYQQLEGPGLARSQIVSHLYYIP